MKCTLPLWFDVGWNVHKKLWQVILCDCREPGVHIIEYRNSYQLLRIKKDCAFIMIPFWKHFIFSNWILSSNGATLTSYLHYNCHQEIVWMSFYWNLWMSIWFQFRFMDHYVFSYKCHNHNTTCPITSWYWMKMPISIIVCLKGILSTIHEYHKYATPYSVNRCHKKIVYSLFWVPWAKPGHSAMTP